MEDIMLGTEDVIYANIWYMNYKMLIVNHKAFILVFTAMFKELLFARITSYNFFTKHF